jgi:hypothetical protein
MVEEVFTRWTHCLLDADKTNIGWYGTPFPDFMLSNHGVNTQPSTYGPIHYLADYPSWLRNFRERQSAVTTTSSGASSKPRQLIPWLTACTYGQMDARLTLDGALHSFGSGTTGFSFFIDSCFDDPAKMLALSTATAYAVPFEDWMMDADLVRGLTPRQNILAWSGVCQNDTYWLVLTPVDHAQPLHFGLLLGQQHQRRRLNPADAYSVCDLTRGESKDATTIGHMLDISVDRRAPAGSNQYSSSYVLLVSMKEASSARDCKAVALPTSAWLPG